MLVHNIVSISFHYESLPVSKMKKTKQYYLKKMLPFFLTKNSTYHLCQIVGRVATQILNQNFRRFQEVPGDFGNFFQKKLWQ